MLKNLFKYSAVLARHQSAPLLKERECYLAHCASEVPAADTLRSLAGKLLIVTQHLVYEVASSQSKNKWDNNEQLIYFFCARCDVTYYVADR